MAILLTDAGKQKALEYLVGKNTTTESLILKLYSNNYTPDIEDTLDDYVEVTIANGYAAKGLSLAQWSVAAGSAVYPQQTWTFTGAAGNIYGYYAISSVSNEVIFAERFPDGPYIINTNGDVLKVTLNIVLT